MDLRKITSKERVQYDKVVSHVIQSWEWGEFRARLGLPLLRYGLYEKGKLKTAFQLTLHKIPFTKYFVGYLPKGPEPNKALADALQRIGRENRCAFIKVEPNVIATGDPYKVYPTFLPSPKALFTKYNFIVDLTKSEEELLKSFHPKTRYNIKVAQKHGLVVEERLDDKAFKDYLKLYFDTTERQQYFGHNKSYHKAVWETLKKNNMARLLIAYYKGKPLTAWLLLNFKETLYYPYGGSSDKYRETMSSNLVAWEAIKLGKRLGCKSFDMWGALGPDAPESDPWYGFHRFKKGYGGELVEYIGTYDLIFNSNLYWAFTSVDKFTKVKVALLKFLHL